MENGKTARREFAEASQKVAKDRRATPRRDRFKPKAVMGFRPKKRATRKYGKAKKNVRRR